VAADAVFVDVDVEPGVELCATGATAPAGSVSDIPGVIKLEGVIPLAASNAPRLTFTRAAITLNESPALTVYVPPDEPLESV